MPTTSPAALRAVTVVLLLALAFDSLLTMFAGFRAEPYIGVGHLMLTAAALVAAWVLLASAGCGAWWFAGTLGVLTIAAYLISRLTGLPLFHDQVGRWLTPAGVGAAYLGVLLAAVSVWGLLSQHAQESRREASRPLDRSLSGQPLARRERSRTSMR